MSKEEIIEELLSLYRDYDHHDYDPDTVLKFGEDAIEVIEGILSKCGVKI